MSQSVLGGGLPGFTRLCRIAGSETDGIFNREPIAMRPQACGISQTPGPGRRLTNESESMCNAVLWWYFFAMNGENGART